MPDYTVIDNSGIAIQDLYVARDLPARVNAA